MGRFRITDAKAREIIDCRGWPTVQADIWVDGTLAGRADVPQGRSTGTHEAHVLLDGEPDRYSGQGVLRAVANVNGEIAELVRGMDVTDQRAIDFAMCGLDGTPDKSRLGANAIVGVSLAVARAAANVCGVPLYRYLRPTARVLPVPLMNCLNGGKLTANELEIQEFIIIPVGAETYRHALQITTEINEALRDVVIRKYGILATNTGDEGGFATPMHGIWEPFEFMQRACESAGYKVGFGEEIIYGLDCAASHWFDEATGLYELNDQQYDRGALIELYKQVAAKYPLGSIEPTFQEVHRSAADRAVLVLVPELHRQSALGELGAHPEQAGDDHPQRRARSADRDRDRDAGDVADANGAGHRRRQRLEVRDLPRVQRVGVPAADEL